MRDKRPTLACGAGSPVPYSPECVEKLFGNSQLRVNLLTISRIMAA